MKVKKSKHKKVKFILDNKLTDLFISHETGYSDEEGEVKLLVGSLNPVEPLSLKNKTAIWVDKGSVLFEE